MSSSLRDLKRAKGSAPSQGWQGPRTKWSGARDNSASYVDPLPSSSSGPSGPSSSNAYSSSGGPYSSGPYGSSHQQNLASGIGGDPGASRTRDAGSRFTDRYGGQRSYSSADPVATTAAEVRNEPKRGNSWSSWLGGGKKSAEPEAHDSHRTSSDHSARSSPSGTPNPDQGGHKSSWGSWGHKHENEARNMPDRPRRGRYIPPSERKPGDPMFEPAPKPVHRGPRVNEDDSDPEPDPNDNSWGAWAQRQTKVANSYMQAASEKLNEGWDSVNDSQKRDKALTSVGNGAAKVAGNAVKYTAKGIWNTAKYAAK